MSAPHPARLARLVVALLIALSGLIAISAPANAAGATITGRFVSESGATIDAISAELLKDGNVVESVSKVDGTFDFTNVAPGTYILDAVDPFYNYSMPDLPITVADGETKNLGDIELDFSALIHPDTRLTGFVRDPAGKPVRGIQVLAKNSALAVEPNDPGNVGGFGVTDRTGRYTIDTNGSIENPPVPGTYKLAFSQRVGLDEPFAIDRRYSGDQPTWNRATTVTIDATLQTVSDVTVVRNGGISGAVTGAPALTNGTVTVYDADGDLVVTKAATAGVYSIATLRPGSYYLRFSSTDGGGTKFIRAYWPNAASITGASPVVVKSGVFRVGVDQALSDQLTAYKKPTISGRVVVGSTLTAAPGSWSLTSATEYTYQWLRAGVDIPAATAKTYKPVAADAGKTLSVRVGARNLDRSGTAASASTATVRFVSTVTAKGVYTRSTKKLRLTVKVSVPGLSNPGGTVTVKDGTRTVKSGVTVRNGVAVVTLLRPKPGRHTYGLRYSGTSKVLSDTGRLRFSVPR